jgi:L-alanine-DL-glutamate epimerase-like enolase superfamily enzyme
VLPLVDLFDKRRRRVSFHEFAEIHEHCALVGTVVDHIEMFPKDRPFDVRHWLTETSAHERVQGGSLVPGNDPGLGVALNMDQVARHSIRHGRIAA